MKNIILIVSLLLMGVSSRADILNSSDNKNVADKFDPMLKAASVSYTHLDVYKRQACA